MLIRLTPTLRAGYVRERSLAAGATQSEVTWRHLERAHVLAQPFVVAHVGVHVAMLRRGISERDRREVAGQLVRIVLAGPASAVGRTPVGNTGRADVPLSTTLPVEPDLAEMLESIG